MDELAPEGVTHIVELIDGSLKKYDVTPADFGLDEASLDSIAGGDPAYNARAIAAVLNGADHPARTGVLMNAAAALYVAGAADTLRAGADLAAETIETGKAARTLAALTEEARRAA